MENGYESILLFEDSPLDITEDHFGGNESNKSNKSEDDTFNSTLSSSGNKENFNYKDIVSTSCPNVINNETINILNPSHSYAQPKSFNEPSDEANVETLNSTLLTNKENIDHKHSNTKSCRQVNNSETIDLSYVKPKYLNGETNEVNFEAVENVQQLHKNINALHEKSVNESKNVQRVLDIVTQLSNRVKFLEEEFKKVPDLASRILVIETQQTGDATLTKKEKENIYKKINDNKTRIGNLRNYEDLLDNTQELTSYAGNFEECNQKIETLQQITNDIRRNLRKEIQGEIYREKFKPVDYSNTTFNHDVVLLVDSNLGKVNSDILNHGSRCNKIFCPTLRHVNDLLDKVKIIKQPDVIFLHTGTNHLDEPDFYTEQLEKDYVDIILKLKSMSPNSKIIISSLLPRKELHLKMVIASFNDFLLGVVSSFPDMKFMRNMNVKQYMLRDKKHVDEEGFKILLSNIRYTIFGKIPHYINYQYGY